MEENKKSKKRIIITILILVIIALAGVGGYFGYKIWKDSQTTGTDWGDTYLDNLADKISNGEYENTENSSFGFIQFEESKKPAMVLNYETETNKVMEISVLDSENTIKSKTYETEKENELNIEMLYDIESKEYNWYEHEKKQDGTEIFTEVAQNDIEKGTDIKENKTHKFTKEEMTKQEVEEGEIPSIPKFDEEFVKPDIELDKTDIDLKNKDIDKKDIKEKVEKAIEDYKPQEENITDEVKDNVDNSLKDLETKKEEIKKAEEEKAKKEAEEKAKAEEEARKKAEEEAKKKAEEEAKKKAETSTQKGKITVDEAEKLAGSRFGNSASNPPTYYDYTGWGTYKGKQYYVFNIRWLAGDHLSWIGVVCVSMDGKSYEQMDMPISKELNGSELTGIVDGSGGTF